MDDLELANWFAYHPPSSPEVEQAHTEVRALAHGFAARLNALLPDSREKAMALRAVDDACIYANACIAPFAALEPREQDKDAVFIALCEIARQWIRDPEVHTLTDSEALDVFESFLTAAREP